MHWHCTHAFTHLHASIHAYMHTCMHTYMHKCILTYKHACLHTCIHAYMPTDIHACMPSCINIYIYICIFFFICIHACMLFICRGHGWWGSSQPLSTGRGRPWDHGPILQSMLPSQGSSSEIFSCNSGGVGWFPGWLYRAIDGMMGHGIGQSWLPSGMGIY